MVEIVEGLSRSVDLKPGDRVKTLRGTLAGRILRLLPDGRVVWQPDGGQSELVALTRKPSYRLMNSRPREKLLCTELDVMQSEYERSNAQRA